MRHGKTVPRAALDTLSWHLKIMHLTRKIDTGGSPLTHFFEPGKSVLDEKFLSTIY